MKASELITYLQSVIQNHGDCEILHWDLNSMSHIPVIMAKYINKSDFISSLEGMKEYEDNFNKTLGNVVLE